MHSTNLETVRFLFESGANLDDKDDMCDTPKTSRFILRAQFHFGLIFRISFISGQTALILSSHYGRLEITRFLVESGANMEVKDHMYDFLKA
jgi:ankyrin repeat protein